MCISLINLNIKSFTIVCNDNVEIAYKILSNIFYCTSALDTIDLREWSFFNIFKDTPEKFFENINDNYFAKITFNKFIPVFDQFIKKK